MDKGKLIKKSPSKNYLVTDDDENYANNLLHDPAGAYVTKSTAHYASYANAVALLDKSKKGLNAKAALDFLDVSGFSHQQFQDVFKTTVKTIQNYTAQHQKLDAALSEKLLKSFALFEKGIAVFGSANAFYQWLKQPAYGLGNQAPLDLMDMITGINLIEEEMIRLTYGDLA